MKTRVWFVLFVCLLLCGCNGLRSTQTANTQSGYLLIDPGHGGADGGTVAADGTQEKDINLAIGLNLRDVLLVCGFPVVMTREADISIHDPDVSSIRGKKVSDMQNRLALYNQADTVIAIHQNHFSVSKYSGAQTFYSPNHPGGHLLAASIQQTLIDIVQPHNTREIKEGTDGIYLLHHARCPAVLLECGFLSNPAELDNLKDTSYRQSLTFAVVGGYWNYLRER